MKRQIVFGLVISTLALAASTLVLLPEAAAQAPNGKKCTKPVCGGLSGCAYYLNKERRTYFPKKECENGSKSDSCTNTNRTCFSWKKYFSAPCADPEPIEEGSQSAPACSDN